MINNNCKECGCACKNCGRFDNDIHLHLEIENLKQKLLERDNHIVKMETNFLNESNIDCDEVLMLKDELETLQEKYDRLLESHKRVQRVNQGLEDKLLKLVDACETEKNALTKDVAILSEKLAEANYSVKKLTESNERYKNDVNVAIQFLQCKQSNFVAHKFDSLPPEIQNEVSAHMTHKRKPDEKKIPELKSIKVPIPTFPPTAMFYSVPKSPEQSEPSEMQRTAIPSSPPTSPQVDVVSAAIMAKVLEERQKERLCVKHCDTCTCSKNFKLTDPNKLKDATTQTDENNCKNCDKKCANFENSDNHTGVNNIVKVQPNNFLVEKSSSSTSSSLLELGSKTESTFQLVNEKLKPRPVKRMNVVHAHCKTEPRLLPVIKNNKSLKPHHSHVGVASPLSAEVSSEIVKKIDVDKMKTNDSVEVISRENFETVDRTKYQEMEEHVKMFLFKKTELWKESSLDVLNNENTPQSSQIPNTFSHTQTDI